MKNTLFLFVAAFLLTATVKAQSTADSIAAKYQLLPMPGALTIEKTFPVLGSYTLNSTNGSQDIVVSLDEQNKGIVWIDGLPEGRIKAYLKQAPATYRIVAQKSASGKSVPEGTLYFDPATSNLNIALGKAFNSADPIAVFNLDGAVNATAGTNEVKVKTKTATSKTKQKVLFYTALKAEAANTTATPAVAPVPNTQK
jgi:hypothetical protein